MQFDVIISAASVVIAICAFVVTVWQVRAINKHNRLSVKPFLATTEGRERQDNDLKIFFQIENCGVGPAIIKSFALLDGETEICKNNPKFLQSQLDKITSEFKDISTSHFIPRFVLRVGAKHTLLEFSYAEHQDISFVDKLNIIIEYQSIYQDEIFIYDSRTDRQFYDRERRNV